MLKLENVCGAQVGGAGVATLPSGTQLCSLGQEWLLEPAVGQRALQGGAGYVRWPEVSAPVPCLCTLNTSSGRHGKKGVPRGGRGS